MSVSRKNNETVTIPQTSLSPAGMFGIVCRQMISAREAALLATYSVVSYLLVSSYLRNKDDKDYMTASAATTYVKDELAKQTSVKHRMLDNYVNTGRALFDKISTSPKLFGNVISEIAKLTDAKAEKAPVILRDFFETNHNVKGLNDLMAKLGYAVRAPKTESPSADPAKAADNAADAITRNIKLLTDKGHKRPAEAQRAIAQSVANAFDNPMMLARQAIARIVDPADLLDLVKACEAAADKLEAEIKASEAAEKKAAKSAATVEHTQA